MTRAIESNPIGLLNRIKKAESDDELLALIAEGDGYKFASDKTRRKWEKAILARRAQLSKPDTESKPKPKAKKRRKSK